MLQRFETELTAKSTSMAEINRLADELINDDDSNTTTVKKRRKGLNERLVKQKLLMITTIFILMIDTSTK